jgi:hypothetical protein
MAAKQYNLLQNRVTRPGQNEVLRQSFYDFAIYPFAGVLNGAFFQQPKGAGQASYAGAVAGQGKTLQDTNMDLQGMIPSGKVFKIESIEVPFFPGSINTANLWLPAAINAFAAAAATTVQAAMQDVSNFYQNGAGSLFILSKSYLDEAPLLRFPPKTHLDYRFAAASNSATVGETAMGAAFAVGRPYKLDPEITLTSVQNFAFNISFGALVPAPSGFNARYGVIFDGILERSSQ